MLNRRPLCLLAFVLVCLCSFLQLLHPGKLLKSPDLRQAEALYEREGPAVISGIVKEVRREDGYGLCTLRKVSLQAGEHLLGIGGVTVLTEETAADSLKIGWIVRAEGDLSRISGPSNPGEFDEASYYGLQGICFRMKRASITVLRRSTCVPAEVLAGLRRSAVERIFRIWPEDEAGVLCAMLTGEREGLTSGTRRLWQTGGILHMLAISGLHLTFLGLGLFRLLLCLHLPRPAAAALSLVSMLLYTCFVGCPVSALRALVMLLLLLLARLVKRTYDSLSALALSAIFLLVLNPQLLTDHAFQLSCSAVFLTSLLRGRSHLLHALLLYLWMLPLTACIYCEIPLWSVPVNLAAVPLLPLLLVSGIGGLIGSLPAGPASGVSALLSLPALLMIRGLTLLLRLVKELPGADLVTGRPGPLRLLLCVLFLALWTHGYLSLRLSNRRFLLLPLLPVLLLLLTLRLPGRLKLTFLSVGQGDGICAQLPGGECLLVDGGSTTVGNVGERRLLPFLKYEGIRKLTYLFVTHTDEDHVNGIRELLTLAEGGLLPVKLSVLVLPDLLHRNDAWHNLADRAERLGMRVLAVKKGDHIRIGEVELEVLGPDPALEGGTPDLNAQCIVLALHYRSFDALLTGDVEGEGEAALLRELAGAESEERTWELLKVAHHGSAYSTPEAFLQLVRPAVSVVSSGLGNRYGHPHEELLTRLQNSGTRIFRTDEQGAVTAVTDGRTLQVGTFRPASAAFDEKRLS